MPSLYHKRAAGLSFADGGTEGDDVAYPGGGTLWTGLAYTVGGVATFYPTDDGTAAGAPLFSEIDSVQLTAWLDTDKATFVPLASLRSISLDLSTVQANVVRGVTLAALGDTIEFVGDQIPVYALIVGVGS